MLLAAVIAFDLMLGYAIWRMIRQAQVYRTLEPEGNAARPDWPQVGVVVPARNEADVIARCIRSLMTQDYPPERLSICLVDDGSSDGTAEIASVVAGADPRVRILKGAALPAGWTGKSFACSQGAGEVSASPFLCFIDADTVAEPGLIRAAVARMQDRRTALMSLEPFQELGSVVERLVMPCGLYLVAASQDVARINAPDRPDAAANGQFMLFARDAYDKVGGHAAVRSEICEDTALARLIKGSGFGFELLGAERLISTRMYRDPHALWAGLAKNATVLGGGAVRTVLIALGGLLMVGAALLLATLVTLRLISGASHADWAASFLMLCGLLSMLGLHLAGTRHFKIPPTYGFLFPLGYLLCLMLALQSARLVWLGRVHWKDRTYHASNVEPSAS